MKCSIRIAVLLLVVIVILFLPTVPHARHLGKPRHSHGHHHHGHAAISTKKDEAILMKAEKYWVRKPRMNHRKPDTLQIAGSSLPDCSHACGSCTPCRLVMVSFVCSTIEEAETCPMAYRCMCHGKSYPVP